MAPKRKQNQDSEAAGQAKRARKAPAARVVSENSPRPPFQVTATIKWPNGPPNSKGFQSIVQTTIRCTAAELGLPLDVPAPILAIPSAPGIPTRPNCKIAFPDLVLPIGVRPPWEEQPGPRYPPPVQTSPLLSRPGVGSSSVVQIRRTTSTASFPSSQVPSSSPLFIHRPASTQSGSLPPATKTKAAPPPPFLRRVPRALPSSQPLPATAQPPAPQPAPASQNVPPAQNSPILDEPTSSFIDSSHHSPPHNVSANDIPLRRENAISPVGVASPPPPVAHSPPQPRPVQVSHQPRPHHSPPPSNVSSNPMPLGAASPPPPVPQMVHNSPPQLRPVQISPQLNPVFATSPPRVPQGLPPQPRPLRREETMVWPSSFGTQMPSPISQGAHIPPRPNFVHAARPLPAEGQMSSQAATRPVHRLPQRPGPIPIPMPTPTPMSVPIPMQSVHPNNNQARHHGGSRQPNAHGPSYPQPPRSQQQRQQYRAPLPSASYYPGPPQQQQYRAPPPSASYHPGQGQYQGGYNLNQQMHGSNQHPGAPSGARTPYTQTPSNHPPYAAPAHEQYSPARPNFTSNSFGADNPAGYPTQYMGQPPPRNNGGYNGGWR